MNNDMKEHFDCLAAAIDRLDDKYYKGMLSFAMIAYGQALGVIASVRDHVSDQDLDHIDEWARGLDAGIGIPFFSEPDKALADYRKNKEKR